MKPESTTSPKKPSDLADVLASDTDSSSEARSQGRAIMMGIAIIALLFINGGIFYTTQLTKKTNSATSGNTPSTITTTKLDTVSIDRLKGREAVDVNAKLAPTGTGRANPFNSH